MKKGVKIENEGALEIMELELENDIIEVADEVIEKSLPDVVKGDNIKCDTTLEQGESDKKEEGVHNIKEE